VQKNDVGNVGRKHCPRRTNRSRNKFKILKNIGPPILKGRFLTVQKRREMTAPTEPKGIEGETKQGKEWQRLEGERSKEKSGKG
jgi:hypothetical protein